MVRVPGIPLFPPSQSSTNQYPKLRSFMSISPGLCCQILQRLKRQAHLFCLGVRKFEITPAVKWENWGPNPSLIPSLSSWKTLHRQMSVKVTQKRLMQAGIRQNWSRSHRSGERLRGDRRGAKGSDHTGVFSLGKELLLTYNLWISIRCIYTHTHTHTHTHTPGKVWLNNIYSPEGSISERYKAWS
jgi:hypothetical protein